MSQTQQDKFLALLPLYSDVIASGPNDLGYTQVLSHHIDTRGAPPICQAACQVPMPHREKVEKILNDNVKQENHLPINEPTGITYCLGIKEGWVSLILYGLQKDQCCYMKGCLWVDDIFDTLAGSSWFSALDLKSGYWQVEVNPRDSRLHPTGCVQIQCNAFWLVQFPGNIVKIIDEPVFNGYPVECIFS